MLMNQFALNLNFIFNNISIMLLSIWIVLEMPYLHHSKWFLRLIITIIIIVSSLYIPLYHGYNLLFIMHSVVGDLSITTLLILFFLIFQDFFIFSKIFINFNIINKSTAWLIFITGSLLYISRFGLIHTNFYQLGFYPKEILLFIVFAELIFWYINKWFAFVWFIALIAFYFKIQTSINLWDYMFDPILLIIALYRGLVNKKLTKPITDFRISTFTN